jgi:hypothetical protein
MCVEGIVLVDVKASGSYNYYRPLTGQLNGIYCRDVITSSFCHILLHGDMNLLHKHVL